MRDAKDNGRSDLNRHGFAIVNASLHDLDSHEQPPAYRYGSLGR